MTVQDFAKEHNLRVHRDSVGDSIIPGKKLDRIHKEDACHVFDGFDNGLGVCFMFPSPKKWTYVRHALEATGAITRQCGHTEGTMQFDPANEAQVEAIIRLAGLKKIRTLTPDQLLAAKAALETARKAA